jgi:adenylosuccinate synthase
VLRRVPGWTEDITGITRFEKLPPNAQLYCHTVQELIGRPIEFVSVGPDRSQTIRIG